MKERLNINKIPEFLVPDYEVIIELRNHIITQLENLEKLIKEKGDVRCFKENPEFVDLFHDFLFFVLIKSYKSINASLQLADNFFQEDSLILLRSVYENYLSINYVTFSPNEISHFTRRSLGVATKYFTHPKTNKGRIQRNKIIDPKTGAIEDFGLPLKTMVESLSSDSERKLHQTLYPFLCEHVHLNMISSGNYRNSEQKKYVDNNLEGFKNPYITISYLLILFSDYLTTELGMTNKILEKRIYNHNKKLKKSLDHILKQFDFENSQVMLEYMLERINQLKSLKNASAKQRL